MAHKITFGTDGRHGLIADVSIFDSVRRYLLANSEHMCYICHRWTRPTRFVHHLRL